MSTPIVAGAIALLWDAVPELKGLLDATYDLVRRSSVNITTTTCTSSEAISPNNVYGHGGLNAKNLIEYGIKEFRGRRCWKCLKTCFKKTGVQQKRCQKACDKKVCVRCAKRKRSQLQAEQRSILLKDCERTCVRPSGRKCKCPRRVRRNQRWLARLKRIIAKKCQ
eukprot:m.297790 g.297790  ORF g.297790 m.297790 type:complete len:166 (-) comp84209_c0_seq1:136-633(-)